MEELTLPYGGVKPKNFMPEEDRFLVVCLRRVGWGQWGEIKLEVRRSWRFRCGESIGEHWEELGRTGLLWVEIGANETQLTHTRASTHTLTRQTEQNMQAWDQPVVG